MSEKSESVDIIYDSMFLSCHIFMLHFYCILYGSSQLLFDHLQVTLYVVVAQDYFKCEVNIAKGRVSLHNVYLLILQSFIC